MKEFHYWQLKLEELVEELLFISQKKLNKNRLRSSDSDQVISLSLPTIPPSMRAPHFLRKTQERSSDGSEVVSLFQSNFNISSDCTCDIEQKNGNEDVALPLLTATFTRDDCAMRALTESLERHANSRSKNYSGWNNQRSDFVGLRARELWNDGLVCCHGQDSTPILCPSPVEPCPTPAMPFKPKHNRLLFGTCFTVFRLSQ